MHTMGTGRHSTCGLDDRISEAFLRLSRTRAAELIAAMIPSRLAGEAFVSADDTLALPSSVLATEASLANPGLNFRISVKFDSE